MLHRSRVIFVGSRCSVFRCGRVCLDPSCGWVFASSVGSVAAVVGELSAVCEAASGGDARSLSVAQAEENLAYLLEVRELRLQIMAELLGHFGIDLHAGLTAEDPRDLLQSLDLWARAQWPTAYTRQLDRLRVTGSAESVPKVGDYIVLSMLMDVAIVLGETVTRRRSDYSWQLDTDPRRRNTLTYRRVVLVKEFGELPPLALDFELDAGFDDFDQVPTVVERGAVSRQPGVATSRLRSGNDERERIHDRQYARGD